MIFKFVVLLWFSAQFAISTKVQLSTGIIEGKQLNSTYSPFGNQSAIAFLGIPYVEPPIGDLRFRKPRPQKTWSGVLETKKFKPACMSNSTKTYKNGGIGGPISEDCLYLNVLTNQYCLENKNCSVVIIVHGGGYLFESAATFNHEILVNNFVGQDRNIVVVTINYRLGIFGFGHLNGFEGDKNVGIFDTLEAVKWVRREIKQFGGNKDRITLAGHSAGAGVVAAFTISPLTKGLIHQQIVMSGPMTNMSKKSNFKGMTAMAERVGCHSKKYGFNKLPEHEVEQVYSCLRKKPAQELLDAQLWLLQNSTFYFGAPPVDGEFITDYPDNLYSEKSIFSINTLLGTTTRELQDTGYISNSNYSKFETKETFLKNLCDQIGIEIYKESEDFSSKCQKWYINGSDSKSLSDDMEFYTQAINLADAHARKGKKVYMYSYAYSGAGPAFKKYMKVKSPHHSEDLIYTFGTHRGVFAPKDYVIEYIYSGMFADFINFEDPSPSTDQPWLQYTKENKEYFLVDFDQNLTMPGMKKNYYAKAYEFWSTAGQKSFKEEWSPSLDTFIITNLVAPIITHMDQITFDVDKTVEQMEILKIERENFLKSEKLKRKSELEMSRWIKKGRKRVINKRMGFMPVEIIENEESESDGGFSIGLLLFGGTLLGGIVYVSSYQFFRRSRNGYQLIN
ncbi:Carboxylic ester hydrolase [Caenorhabditis elegans]|uniref:Carboxylic ester hydrolase n=1 Tax=Caenorhabditis elegans TaxID=6239 RepID=P92016_CAEEL|nr:Carboxylic ester hydrolase [Caenorhabditis elegans]CAB03273.2 Carboxylic ester hydrolase [Caenorhabditis elegans]|eukprot:NP_506504.2 Carboxylic ester hydrolase [Caenorhabditis elegans]